MPSVLFVALLPRCRPTAAQAPQQVFGAGLTEATVPQKQSFSLTFLPSSLHHLPPTPRAQASLEHARRGSWTRVASQMVRSVCLLEPSNVFLDLDAIGQHASLPVFVSCLWLRKPRLPLQAACLIFQPPSSRGSFWLGFHLSDTVHEQRHAQSFAVLVEG